MLTEMYWYLILGAVETVPAATFTFYVFLSLPHLTGEAAHRLWWKRMTQFELDF
jgi:hypothetical protein